MRRLLPGFRLLLFVTLPLLQACQDDEAQPAAVPIARELGSRWELLPHRLSLMEVSFEPDEGQDRGRLHGACTGGGFGAIDVPWMSYGLSVWRSRRMAFEAASVELEIPPGSEDRGDPYAVGREVTLPAGELAGATAVVALIRGFRLSTDEYDEPPPFESDPDLPYDAGEGFTSQGLGISLSPPTLSGDQVTLTVRARNSLGLSDRADMNAAIPRATTWIRVDLLLVGAWGEGASLASGETQYDISAAEYGQNTVHEHAPEAAQRVVIEGQPGPSQAIFGLSGFDFWLNLEGRHDPSCLVVQDEINSWGEPVSGPGRYVTSISARLHDERYDPASGRGEALADLMLSNSSTYKEVGNLCLRARAEVSMLQLDDPEAELEQPDPIELRLTPGQPRSREVTY
jgi:hypothetical protein